MVNGENLVRRIIEPLKKGIAIQKEVRRKGGNTFEQIVAAVNGTNLCEGNIIRYAHQTLVTQKEVDAFLEGFARHIKEDSTYSPNAKKNPLAYARRKFEQEGFFIARPKNFLENYEIDSVNWGE